MAIVALGGTGVALATAWSPTAALVAPAAASDDDDGDDDGDDDDGGRVPAGGVATGFGGAAGDDDDGGDDDEGRAPAGGVDTGLGGAAGDDDGDDGAGGGDDGRDDDDDGRDDDGDDRGQGAPAPAPAAGGGGDDDDDGGQVPAGGIQTGLGGATETVSSTGEQDDGAGDVARVVVPAAALGLGGYALLRMRAARSDAAT